MDTKYTAWPENFPETTCLVPYTELRHSADPEIKELYDRAKNHEDKEAAAELINRLVTNEGVEKTIDKIKQIAAKHPHAIITHVHAIEGKGRNAIPQALAEFVGAYSNLEVDNSIVQTNIVSKTGVKSAWYRFARRAAFEGSVKAGREYILVDDVISAGGTFSEFRHFIESNGGNVVDTITMANGAKSLDARLAVTPGHILELENKYGVESVRRFLQEEDLYGGNHKALTDAEARTLLGAASLDEARNRIAEARQERRFGVFPEVVPGTPPDTEARTLLGAASLDEARNRIAEARQEGIHRTRSEIFPGTPPDTGGRTFLGAAGPDEAGDRIAEAKQERSRGIRREVVPETPPNTEKITDSKKYSELLQKSLNEINNATVSYTEKLKSLKERYAGAFSRYGIKSDEAQQAYREYTDYEMLKRFDPAGVRKGRYDADDGEAERMIKAIRTRLDAENEQRKRLTPASHEAENTHKEKNTMGEFDKLFDYVKEHGSYEYHQQSYEIQSDHGPGKWTFLDIYKLHTAAAIEAAKWYTRSREDIKIDLSTSPFWVTIWCEDRQSLDIVPVKNGDDIIKIHEQENEEGWKGFVDLDELAYNLQHAVFPEKVQDHAQGIAGEETAALHEAENNISKEQSMSDEQLETEAAEAMEAIGPEEQAAEQAPEGFSPEEAAFRNAVHQRKQIAESLKNGSLPCLPGKDGYADTAPAVNLTTGTRYHGANLLYLKDFQQRNGFPTAEYATPEAIQKSGVFVRKGEKGITINFSEKNKTTGEWETKSARLFNVAQLAKPWEFKKYAEGLAAAKEQEKQDYLKSQYGAAYKPREKAEREPGPEIACSSTEPERYLGQYLAAVSLGGKFKATEQQASEFAQKMEGKLYERGTDDHLDPFKLSKICNEANVRCKEIVREITQPEPKQEQKLERKQSRHL